MERLSASIVITNWNGKELLQETLPTIIDAVNADGDHDYEIIVVDDCSTDGSVDFVRMNFPDVRVEKPPQNLGFQRACNFGVEKSQYDIVKKLKENKL